MPDSPVVAADTSRPRIALVLSGGGARGAAHVGVIRVLEELQIPVDIVVGTSMGAVVGGLYASGLNADELEQVIDYIDWRDAFIDNPPRKDLTYRRKRDDDEFQIKFDLGVRDGRVKLPKGIIQGQKLALYLREFSLGVAHIDDFDELPTPFRAVAADLVSGDKVVLAQGDLALAMRASMSAPGIFAPAEVGGRTLVDGGIALNLPIEVAHELGADIVIAVDVGFPLLPADQIESALDVSNQMLTILIERQTRDQRELLGDADVLIQPDLGLLGSTQFELAEEAIEIGYRSADLQRAALASLSIDLPEYRAHVAARQARQNPEQTPDFVRVTTDARISSRVIETRLATLPGQPLSIEALREDMARIYGLGLFEQVDFRWAQDETERGIEIDARARSWGPGYLRFGMALEEDFEGSGSFSVSARYLRTAVNRLGAEWRSNVEIGTNSRLESEFYQPLSFDLRYFVAPIVELEQRNINLFEGEQSIARYRLSTAGASIFVGRELSNWGELRAGIYRGAGNARVKVGDPTLSRLDFNIGGYRTSFGFDTLDDTVFPLNGSRYELQASFATEALGARRDYETLRSSYAGYRTYGRHTFSLALNVATGSNIDDLIEESTQLGGFLNLSGLDRGALAGPHALLGRFVYRRRSGSTGGGLFELPLYVGASLEAGNVWAARDEFDLDDLVFNGSVYVALDTFIGPVYFATGFGESGETSVYLFLGAQIN